MRDINSGEAAGETGRASIGAIWVMGQMFFIPLRTFVYGMGMMAEAMRDLQEAGRRGTEVIAGAAMELEPAVAEVTNLNQPAVWGGTERSNEEITRMDQSLNTDRVKLVRYKILSLKRGHEHIIHGAGGEELVTENMDDGAYKVWKIAEHCKQMNVPSEDQKYLRVYFEVLDSYDRQELKYHEDQLQVLREIRDNIGGAASKIGPSQ
jgi:hypothetical protein